MLDQIKSTKNMSCGGCLEAKLRRAPNKRKTHHYATEEAVSSDIMGPLNVPGMSQNFKRYFISFIELTSRYACTKQLHARSETPTIIRDFLNQMQHTCQVKPKWLITGNAGEYTSDVILNMLGEMDIIEGHNSEENGVAERLNLTIMNAV